MKVLFASSECAPFFKTGGLGDVTGALPKELAKNPDMQVAVILPYYKYGIAEHYKAQIKDEFWDYVNVGWRHEYVGVKRLVQDKITWLKHQHVSIIVGLDALDVTHITCVFVRINVKFY